MRIVLVAILCLLFVLAPASAAETERDWLDRAADPGLTLRQREYAARQVLMLADTSASILISALRGEGSDSGLRRQVAAGLLGELGRPVAEAPLLEAAHERDYFLAEAAASALARIYSRFSDEELYDLYRRGGREPGAVPGGAGPGQDDWLVLTLDAAGRSRFRALVMRGLALKYSSGEQPLPQGLAECVWDAFLDPDRDLRLHAVGLAAATADSQAAEKVAALLYMENDVKVLIAALRAMAAMRPPQYGEAVERHVAHAEPMVGLEALATLDAMGYAGAMFPPVPGARAVAVYVAHPSTPVRRRAIEILAANPNPAAIDYLEAALFDRVGANRAAAAQALGEMKLAAAVGSLSPLLRDGRPEARAEAAVALARLGVVGVAAGVLDDLAGDSAPFRRSAAATLGRLGDARAVPHLLAVLDDAEGELACIAAESLGKLGRREAGEKLYSVMVGADDPVLADAARKALSELYLDDPGVTPSSRESWARRNRVAVSSK